MSHRSPSLPEVSSALGAFAQVNTLGQCLEQRATCEPQQTAYSFLDAAGEVVETRTYAALHLSALQVAASIRRHVEPGARVILAFGSGLAFVDAFFGCLHAGVVPVPVHAPRSRTAAARLPGIVRDCAASLALTSGSMTARLRQVLDESVHIIDLATCGEVAPLAAPYIPTADELALLQYTSGSTGAPKGVMVTHQNLMASSEAIRTTFGHSAESRGVIWLPAYHDMGLVGGVLQPLYAGFPVWLMSPLDFLQRPSRWLQAVSRYRATTSGGPNFAYDLCVERSERGALEGLDLSSWKVAFSGAEAVRHTTLQRFAERFAAAGFRGQAFLPCYGLAEATLLVTAKRGGPEADYRVDRALDDATEHSGSSMPSARALVSCGTPAPGHQIAIVSADNRRCDDRQVGEIWVRGPSVARGYWNRQVDTASCFGVHVEAADGAFMRTGDYGYLDRGELFVCGRLKAMIILAGCNYAAEDIEATSSAAHPAFRTLGAAAFGLDDGQRERLVVVQEVARSAVRREDPAELARALQEAVALEHSVPVQDVCLVHEGAIPRTSSGKVRRGVCRDQYARGELSTLAARHAPAEPLRETTPLDVRVQASSEHGESSP